MSKKVWIMTEEWYKYEYDIHTNTFEKVGPIKVVVGVFSNNRKAYKALINRVKSEGYTPCTDLGFSKEFRDDYYIYRESNGYFWHGTVHINHPVFQTEPYDVHSHIEVSGRELNFLYY